MTFTPRELEILLTSPTAIAAHRQLRKEGFRRTENSVKTKWVQIKRMEKQA